MLNFGLFIYLHIHSQTSNTHLFIFDRDFYPNGGRASQPGCNGIWQEIKGKFYLFAFLHLLSQTHTHKHPHPTPPNRKRCSRSVNNRNWRIKQWRSSQRKNEWRKKGRERSEKKHLQSHVKFIIVEACSHGRSHQFFAESIISDKGFTGYPCSSYAAYSSGKCEKTDGIPMGEPTPNTARGVYYLKTSDSSPYAQGWNK